MYSNKEEEKEEKEEKEEEDIHLYLKMRIIKLFFLFQLVCTERPRKFSAEDLITVSPQSISLPDLIWSEFIGLTALELKKKSSSSFDISNLTVCSTKIATNTTLKILSKRSDQTFCRWSLDPKGGKVKLGESYGELDTTGIERFENLQCSMLYRGLDLSCDDVSEAVLIDKVCFFLYADLG
jgi:hypothetical protein